jgi:monoamine oxidase
MKESMTRRHFLERFGAVGGSTLVMSAMASWDLMGAQAGPRPVLTGKANGTKVLVLGGGISGLVAAYELGKLGYDYRVLEARDRVGGVAWSVRRGAEHTEINGERQVCAFDEGMYVNAGPWRIPHFHTGVLGYCKELKVPLQIFINEADASYFYYENKSIGPLANTRVRLREVKADIIGYTDELLAKAVDQGKLDLPLTAEDKERLVNFLIIEGYLDDADHAYRGNEVRGPGDPHDFKALLQSGFITRVRSVMGGTGQAPMFQPVGGMDQFPKAFQRPIGSRLTLNAEVESIHQTADGVRVVYKDTKSGQKKELTADYVISSMPLSVLSTLDVNLSSEMMTAVKGTSYSTSAKMGLQMKRRFWEEDDRIFGGHLYSDLPIGEFSYPSNDFFADKGVLLGFYGGGRTAGLVDMPVRGRIEHVLTHASKVHPQIRQEFDNGYCVWWEKIKYSLGAYAGGGGFAPPQGDQAAGRGNAAGGRGAGGRGGGGRGAGQGGAGRGAGGANARVTQLNRPDGRIYLGCAALSSSPAWMEGAVAAGWSTVKQLHERVMRA